RARERADGKAGENPEHGGRHMRPKLPAGGERIEGGEDPARRGHQPAAGEAEMNGRLPAESEYHRQDQPEQPFPMPEKQRRAGLQPGTLGSLSLRSGRNASECHRPPGSIWLMTSIAEPASAAGCSGGTPRRSHSFPEVARIDKLINRTLH